MGGSGCPGPGAAPWPCSECAGVGGAAVHTPVTDVRAAPTEMHRHRETETSGRKLR